MISKLLIKIISRKIKSLWHLDQNLDVLPLRVRMDQNVTVMKEYFTIPKLQDWIPTIRCSLMSNLVHNIVMENHFGGNAEYDNP